MRNKIAFIIAIISVAASIILGTFFYHLNERVILLETSQENILQPVQQKMTALEKSINDSLKKQEIDLLEAKAQIKADMNERYVTKDGDIANSVNQLKSQVGSLQTQTKNLAPLSGKIAELEKTVTALNSQNKSIQDIRTAISGLEQKVQSYLP